jgi:hypothetical protein
VCHENALRRLSSFSESGNIAPLSAGMNSQRIHPRRMDAFLNPIKPMQDREAAYTQALQNHYEQTRWQILVDGKIIPRIVSFHLHQRFNAHHTFTLRIHHTELEEARNYRLDNTRFLFGKSLTATMGSTLEADRVQFQGHYPRVADP